MITVLFWIGIALTALVLYAIIGRLVYALFYGLFGNPGWDEEERLAVGAIFWPVVLPLVLLWRACFRPFFTDDNYFDTFLEKVAKFGESLRDND